MVQPDGEPVPPSASGSEDQSPEFWPVDGWWRLSPGAALSHAYQDFESGVAYYRLEADRSPPWVEKELWSRLREAYLQANRRAEVARRLVRPQTGGSLVVPSSVATGRKAYEREDREYWETILQCVNEDAEPRALPVPASSIESPAAVWSLYRATLLFAVSRGLPGIREEVVDLDGGTAVVVELDEVLHTRLSTLLNRLAHPRSDRALACLARVARCYLLGLDQELAVMARAALEAYLSHLRGLPESAEDKLANLIDQCQTRSLLSDDAIEAAKLVKAAGNDAAHGRTLTVTPDHLLQALATALAGSPGSKVTRR